jgi:UDP:flavonoid glycosyltransferase YjiC (YdhE family)
MMLHNPPPPDVEFILFTMGSGGDVYPTLDIGKALRDRGHRVVIAANPYFESAARAVGLAFAGIGSADVYRRRLEDPTLWQLGKGFKVLFTDMIDNMRPLYDAIRVRAVPNHTVVIAPSSGLGARVASEKLGVPLVSLQLQPIAFRSLYEQPGITVPGALKPLLPPLRRAWLRVLDRRLLDPHLAPALNGFRAELGLPPVTRVFDGWAFSPDLIIGLFPDWFAPPPRDWPPQLKLTGFPLCDRGDSAELSSELTRFLADGEPPIVFTLGTAMQFAKNFFQTSIDVCQRLQARGVLVTGFAGQLPRPLPSRVLHVPYAPFSRLLPKASVIVHHGGIGTLAQAMRAGIPQLVTPMNFDQPDNAARLSRLGVADRIRLRDYAPAVAAKKLRALLTSPLVASQCRALSQRLAPTDAVAATCRLIESMVPAPLADRGAARHR